MTSTILATHMFGSLPARRGMFTVTLCNCQTVIAADTRTGSLARMGAMSVMSA